MQSTFSYGDLPLELTLSFYSTEKPMSQGDRFEVDWPETENFRWNLKVASLTEAKAPL